MRLENGQNEFSAVFTNPLKIVTAFRLSTAQVPAWAMPRKVSEFAQGMALQIGMKKSWITRKVQPEMVQIDEFVISGFELATDSAQIRLRRKVDTKDSLLFRLRRVDTELLAELHRSDDDPSIEAKGTRFDVRVRNGKTQLTDGPFAETREQLGGYYLVEAKDLDEAIAIAARIPSARHGSVEVRPVGKVDM